ncbi:hypothetical protein [Spirosoma telluris]|uniref:hypothetical protein n=1 Tax=Spirosoma telluris TaxID=2183553 RepID=UPI002FC30947
MKTKKSIFLFLLGGLFFLSTTAWVSSPKTDLAINFAKPAPKVQRLLYVATPGIRNYLGYGGHGIQVFDMDNNHKFVKFIKNPGA